MLVKPPEIWAPGAAVDPVRVLGEVDDRPGLDFVVEDDREVAGERFGLLRRLTGPIACAWPRWAIWRVTSWKASRPLSVKPKVTFGSLNSPDSCFGSVMSVPESAGSSLSAYQPGFGGLRRPCRLRRWGCSETTIVPAGTSTTIPSCGRFSPVGLT